MKIASRIISRARPRAQAIQKRFVSRQVWDIYGNNTGPEAWHIRHAGPYEFAESWFYVKWLWKLCFFGPIVLISWNNGVFDYCFRKRYIPPLEPDWEAEYPYRPPAGYKNPFFAPGRQF